MSAREMHHGQVAVMGVGAPNERTRRLRVGGDALAPLLDHVLPGDAVKVTISDPDAPAVDRVYTLRNIDRTTSSADLDVLLDSDGAGARWAATVTPGDTVAFRGPRYGYRIEPDLTHLVLIGDFTAEPAISEITRELAEGTTAHVLVVDDHDRPMLDVELAPCAADITVRRCDLDELAAAIDNVSAPESRYWCAGAAPLVERARRHIRVDRRIPRHAATFAIYWRPAVSFNRFGEFEAATRDTIRDHGLVLDDPHDLDSIEPLADFDARSDALTTTVDLAGYLRAHSGGSDDTYDRIRDDTRRLAAHGEELPGTLPLLAARLLTLLTHISGARTAIEIGTFTGTSSTAIARGLPVDGRLTAVDTNSNWTRIARAAWQHAGVADRIKLHIGPALTYLTALPRTPTYDLAFIDADKANYTHYLHELLPRMNHGALVIADNTLWQGHVADPVHNDPNTTAIRAFNDAVNEHPHLTSMILPLGDGLTVARYSPSGPHRTPDSTP